VLKLVGKILATRQDFGNLATEFLKIIYTDLVGGSRGWAHLPSARLCIPSDSGRIPTEVGQKSPSGNNVKVQSTGMRYNTILVIPVHSSWYLSTRFLQVEKARTYSKYVKISPRV
jgi:hypothetical protein